jgi:hypothetical protein
VSVVLNNQHTDENEQTQAHESPAFFSRRSTSANNPWLVINMERFNFGGSLSRVLARQQAQLFGR